MSRPLKDTFVIELPLVASLSQDAVMLGRFEAGRRIFNAVLGDALKALDLMRQSVQWQKTRGLPKGKERTEAFKACNKQFGFTEYALHSIAIKHKNAAGFEGRLGAHETQKIASKVFSAAQEFSFGKRGKPRFKGKSRSLHSIEGKSNAAGIRWSKTSGAVTWGKGFVLPVKMPSLQKDPYLHTGLESTTKYCRILWRMEQGRRRWFVQLIQDGVAPDRYEYLSGAQVVGLDIGPSTVAIVADDAVGLESFAPGVVQPWSWMRTLQRAQDRSRRTCNPLTMKHRGLSRRVPCAGSSPEGIAKDRSSCPRWNGNWQLPARMSMANWPTRCSDSAIGSRSKNCPTKASKRTSAEVPRSELPECSFNF